MEILGIIIVVIVGAIIIALPVMLAASAMGASRTGVVWCLVALAGSSILHTIGLAIPCIGSIAAFLLSGLAFAGILGTDFIRGIGIEILIIIFSAILFACLSVVFGFSLIELIDILSEVGLPVSF